MTALKQLPDTTQIALHCDGSTLHVTMARSESRNALSSIMIAELTATFDAVRELPLRTIVLRGAGGNFCAGGDVKEMRELFNHAESNDLYPIVEYNAAFGRLLHLINEAPQAVIVILEGTVLGGGLGLACAADIAIATKDARFGMPETTLGLVPAQIAPFVRRKIGDSYSRLLGIVGASFDAESAFRFGMVHYLVDDEEAAATKLNELLRKINTCAPKALALTKSLLGGDVAGVQVQQAPLHATPGETPHMSEQLRRQLVTAQTQRLAQIFAETMATDEAAEGTRAFVEKRKPTWTQS